MGPRGEKEVGNFFTVEGLRRTAIRFTSAGKLIGRIFRVQELRPLDFIGSRKRDEPTTRNIPELGISAVFR
jgi:hypothetical protein